MAENFKLVQRLDLIHEVALGKSVLHLGCANYPYTEQSIKDGMLLHFSLGGVAAELYGLDFDEPGIEILKAHGAENIFWADLENLDDLKIDRTFDIIIAGEMIEHLNNPGLFFNGIRRFMNAESKLVLTTINAYGAVRFILYGLRGKRGENEFVHPDHVAYYSYSTLKLLVERHRMQVEQFLFYDIGKEHRIHNRWFVNLFNDVSVSLAPQWADGVIAVCELADQKV